MSYHITTPSKKKLKIKFPEHIVFYEGFENYHISTHGRPYLPVTLNNNIHAIATARWKLIPHWIKNEDHADQYSNTFHASAESIFMKRSFKPYVQQQRGLLYVNGFFDSYIKEKEKQEANFFIYHENKEILTLGILYAMFTNQGNNDSYPTFAIITTAANKQLSTNFKSCKRMPLIISPENRLRWLQSSDKLETINLMKPYGGNLAYHRVRNFISPDSVFDNVPSIQEPISDFNFKY